MKPEVHAFGSRVLVQLSDWNSNRFDDQPQTLHCFDMKGRSLWSLQNVELRSILGDACLVDSREQDALLRIDDSGRVTHRISGAFAYAATFGDRLLLTTERSKAQITDLALEPIRRVWGNHHYHPQQCCRRGEDLYAISNDGTISQFSRRGKRRTFATISKQVIEQTFADFERATGFSVCQGWHGEYPKPEDSSERDMLLRIFNWLLTYDSEADVFLASSNQLSHVVVCFESNGQRRWSKFLSPGCCSGPAKRVSNGLWATASGCSGVVNWIDADGELVHRVHGVGSSIEVIRDELVVGSWDQLSAYDEGEPVWHLKRPYSFAVSGSLLATVDEVDKEVEIAAYNA